LPLPKGGLSEIVVVDRLTGRLGGQFFIGPEIGRQWLR
jgi:hypothetical protein